LPGRPDAERSRSVTPHGRSDAERVLPPTPLTSPTPPAARLYPVAVLPLSRRPAVPAQSIAAAATPVVRPDIPANVLPFIPISKTFRPISLGRTDCFPTFAAVAARPARARQVLT